MLSETLPDLLILFEPETGNWTVTGLKQRQQPEFPYNKGSLSTGFLQEKVWMLLLTSLAVPPGRSRGP